MVSVWDYHNVSFLVKALLFTGHKFSIKIYGVFNACFFLILDGVWLFAEGLISLTRDFSRWFYCSNLYFYVFEGGVVALTEEFEWNEISTIHSIAPLVLHKVAYIRTSIFTVNNIQCCIFEPFFDHFSLILNLREVKTNAA